MKCGSAFYEDFADYLEQSGLTHEAALHRRLVILIRQENNWGLKQKASRLDES